ncbi:MAG: hypothetical protein HN704_17585 [Bacteroidetes bacterium]|jgi:hypothetical protein|nr:hypothetical protein [Bacteroidota bacterium]MBT6686627.1 hypothetical protein [Bacteroidota bacterium]MBT7143315.1 hypothetical protein [Bacteroidota bacterium]MBT7493413.1 hypothetical protein [Bacteroidota bacterium]
MTFWDTEIEKKYFTEAMKNFASPEQLFYKLTDGYFAYVPKGKTTEGQTLQSRNSLIGQYTEKWSKDFFQPIAESLGIFAVNGVVCPELGLTTQSDADLAFCTTNETLQKPENIKLLFEIKMSIVNNYKFENDQVKFVGDYKKHKGNPSILRSDSMLKAIGKSINIRVSGTESTKIPIIILGNSPITKNYLQKVDFLKKAGIIQSFISLYPNPTNDFIKNSINKGFQTFNEYQDLSNYISEVVNSDLNFFSSMLPKRKLGQIITVSSKEKDDILKATKFLSLIND